MKLLHYAPHLLCLLGAIGVVFAWWGTKTKAGQRAFDEMAGMIPWGAGVLGIALLVAGAVWFVIRAFR